MTRSLPDLGDARGWIAPIRLVIAPFALLEVAIERGNYPPGHEASAWAIAAAFAVGAIALFVAYTRRIAPRVVGAVGLVFDTAVVSGFVVLYGFEPSSPVRELFFLTAVEAALLFRYAGALVAPLAAIPALSIFEARAADRLDVPFDPGHVVGPAGLQLVVGLVVAALLAGRVEKVPRNP